MSRKRKDGEFAARIAQRVDDLGERANVWYTEGDMRIGDLVTKWRLLSQKQVGDVAKEIGISVSSLRRLEAGKQVPDGATTIKLINWLFSEEPNASTDRVDNAQPTEQPGDAPDAPVGEGV